MLIVSEEHSNKMPKQFMFILTVHVDWGKISNCYAACFLH